MSQALARVRSRTAMITETLPMHIVREDRDAVLVDRLRRHEDAAVEQFVTTYQARAYRLAIGITGDTQDAEEALQDAFWSVISKIDAFRGDSAFGSWVYRIVANAAYQKIRRRARRSDEISLDDVLPEFDAVGRHASALTDWSSSVRDAALQRDLRDALASAIAELPPDYRVAVVMRDVEGMPINDVADALGVTAATVKTRTHRARLRLRQHLSSFMDRDGRRPHRNLCSVAHITRVDAR